MMEEMRVDQPSFREGWSLVWMRWDREAATWALVVEPTQKSVSGVVFVSGRFE